MVNLYDSATGALIGTISDEDLHVHARRPGRGVVGRHRVLHQPGHGGLVGDPGADPALVSLLRKGLGSNDGSAPWSSNHPPWPG